MIPINSNKNSGCDPTSSNCVIWQGPDLTCVNVCEGDTISEIVAKLCEQLVTIQDNNNTGINISLIDQSSLSSTAVTEEALIQNIINALGTSSGDHFDCTDVMDCNVVLPTCLAATYSPNMNMETYLEIIGLELCALATSTNNMRQGSVTSNTRRISELESEARYSTPEIYTTSIGTPASLQTIDSVLQQLEADYILLRNASGLPAALYSGVASQDAVNMTPLFTSTWDLAYHTAPSNVAESLDNLWIVIKDMRNKIIDVESAITEANSVLFPRMGGTSHTFAPGDTCTLACAERAGSNCVNIYNESGGVFDVTVRAYEDSQATTELTHDVFYVICGTGTVGKYSTMSPHWTDIETDCVANC